MQRIGLERLRLELGRWLAGQKRSRLLVTKRGFPICGVCSVADAMLLDRLEESGRLEEMKRDSGSAETSS